MVAYLLSFVFSFISIFEENAVLFATVSIMCEITAIKSSTWSSVIAFEIEPLPYYDMKSLAYYIRMKVFA